MYNWKISLFALLMTILVFIPLSLSLVVTVGSSLRTGVFRRIETIPVLTSF